MRTRQLVIEGPQELVEKLSQIMDLLKGQRASVENIAPLLEQLVEESKQLRACAGNSNLSAENTREAFSIRDIMNQAKEMTIFWEKVRDSAQQAKFGPRTLSPDLGNRQELADHMSSRKDEPTTAIQVGLDGLEKINEAHGREAGDQILKNMASTVKKLVDPSTEVFQDGGNLVLVGNWDSPEEASELAEKVSTQATRLPNGRMLRLTIGIAYEETGDVIGKAEAARANASEGIAVFNPEIAGKQDKSKKERQTALKVLKEKAFYPEYQKIISRPPSRLSRAPLKFEALWRSKELTPFQFFKEIKAENRIHEVTTRLLPMIVKDMTRNAKADVAVNITAEEMSESFVGQSFAAFVTAVLAKYRVDPRRLIIELVEWGDEDRLSDDSMKNLKALVTHGCQFSLDDYGVRSSNLVRLMQMCEHNVIPNFIKIDAALVKGYNAHIQSGAKSADHYSLLGIRNIIELVKELRASFKKDIGIVAEFVSNEKLKKALEKEGVTHFQGFYLAKPVPAEQAFK